MTPEQPTITQADRDTAIYLAENGLRNARPMRPQMVEDIARHLAKVRIAERDAVVKWLRRRITWDENPKALRFKHADAIEAGEHLK